MIFTSIPDNWSIDRPVRYTIYGWAALSLLFLIGTWLVLLDPQANARPLAILLFGFAYSAVLPAGVIGLLLLRRVKRRWVFRILDLCILLNFMWWGFILYALLLRQNAEFLQTSLKTAKPFYYAFMYGGTAFLGGAALVGWIYHFSKSDTIHSNLDGDPLHEKPARGQ